MTSSAAPTRRGTRLGTCLYAIADAESLGTEPRRFADCVAAMIRGGIRLVQLRLKPTDPQLSSGDRLRVEMIEATLATVQDCISEMGEGNGVQLWLDDRPDLACLFPGSFVGVHVGQTDLLPSAVRRVLRRQDVESLVGLSCHDLDQVRAADADPDVNWVAIGPVYGTRSKTDPDPVVGIDGVRSAREATTKPLVAIGGLNADRISEVLEAGADAAVVLSALHACGRDPSEIESTARRLVNVAGVAARSTRIHERDH